MNKVKRVILANKDVVYFGDKKDVIQYIFEEKHSSVSHKEIEENIYRYGLTHHGKDGFTKEPDF